jgi:hypothetical protein
LCADRQVENQATAAAGSSSASKLRGCLLACGAL